MVVAYEQRLKDKPQWAWRESGMHFEDESEVQKTLRRITQRLHDLDISYALVGGMAMFRHGYRRYTEDVDLLVTPASLEKIHAELDGLGYLPPFRGSKHLRDTTTGVKVEFLTTGGFPGDGKEKPVVFPDPSKVAVEIDGVQVLGLPTLLELKLASGMSNVTRAKDIGDATELIRVLEIPRDMAEKLNPYVREKFLELWDALAAEPDELP
ncbi:MAG: nucleotidyl transferase AbiEii/AbiGii toxin family protein [Planctomycetota bacterium]